MEMQRTWNGEDNPGEEHREELREFYKAQLAIQCGTGIKADRQTMEQNKEHRIKAQREEWINQLWLVDLYDGICSTKNKNNKLLLHSTPWTNLIGILVSERGQTEKNI